MATRRFKVYVKFVLSTIGDKVFKHYRVNDLSLYILANKEHVTDMEAYVEEVISNVTTAIRH